MFKGSYLHDVGLMNAGDRLAVVLDGVGESVLGNAHRGITGDDLEVLDDAGNDLRNINTVNTDEKQATSGELQS